MSSDAKRKVQAEVVAKYRPRVRDLVRELVSDASRWEEAEQVGLIGALIALEKHSVISPTFGARVEEEVRVELQDWLRAAKD